MAVVPYALYVEGWYVSRAAPKPVRPIVKVIVRPLEFIGLAGDVGDDWAKKTLRISSDETVTDENKVRCANPLRSFNIGPCLSTYLPGVSRQPGGSTYVNW
jgi:hypothetical protein